MCVKNHDIASQRWDVFWDAVYLHNGTGKRSVCCVPSQRQYYTPNFTLNPQNRPHFEIWPYAIFAMAPPRKRSRRRCHPKPWKCRTNFSLVCASIRELREDYILKTSSVKVLAGSLTPLHWSEENLSYRSRLEICLTAPNFIVINISCRTCGSRNAKFHRILKFDILPWRHLTARRRTSWTWTDRDEIGRKFPLRISSSSVSPLPEEIFKKK